jgi:cell division protein FtsB
MLAAAGARRRFALAFAVVLELASALQAQDNAELLQRMSAMEQRIKALEAEIQTLKGQQPAPAPVTPPAAATPPAAPLAGQTPGTLPNYAGAAAAASKIFNPDISVIGDFLGAAGYGANRATPSLEMHETEVGLQAIIDPYARADVFLSFGEHGVDLEEGYLTFTTLPAGLQVKVGKMRAMFGKVNALHNHVLPWTDRPLVTQNLVAGEEGISDAGLSLSRILPAPKGIFLEGTAQLFRGDTEGLFVANRRREVSTVEHLRAYHDITESTNIDLGASYARGNSPFGDGANQLYGIDATLRWKPLRRSIYHSFVGRSEFIWGRTRLAPSVARPFGYYVSGDYQFGRRWLLGGRFDRSDRLTDTTLHDTGGSILLTYWPSEFSQIRGQLRRTRYGEKLTANEFLFQFQFSMGAHGAHPF